MTYDPDFVSFVNYMIAPHKIGLNTIQDSIHAAALMMKPAEREKAAQFLEMLLASSMTGQELEAFWWRFHHFVPRSPQVARVFTQDCIDILRHPVSPPGWNDDD